MVTEPSRISVKIGDDLELDLRAGELRRSGHLVKIERIPVDLLILLIEQKNQLVTRDQIIERIWGKGVFLDTDNSINAAIRKIRQALKDDPAQPRFVQTITGRGYRFIAPVNEVGAPAAPAEVSPPSVSAEKPPEKPATPAPVQSRRWWPLLLGLSVLVLVALAAYIQWSRVRSHSQASGGRIVLAVLPFENLTGDAGEDYFSDGMTEEMIAQLGRLDPEHLGVIARTSVMRYKHSQDLNQVGHDLGVQYVLEGSVRRDADNVRITAQLIHMKDQTHVWSRQYDRELKNILALQGEIAQEIADEIQLTLGNRPKIAEAAHQPPLSAESLAAYDLYLKGRYFWNKRTAQGFQQAVDHFQQAMAKDPNYAPAYAGLADSYALMSIYNVVPPQEFMPKARAAALRALEIDDKLAEAHTSLAVIAEQYDWDWQTAEKEFKRAIQLDPNYATAHQWYAECLAFQGRFEDALAESERARQLDPLSLIIAADNGAILYFAGKYDLAIQKFRAVLDMEPDFPRAHIVIYAYVQSGQFDNALAEIEKWRRRETSPWTWVLEAYVYARWGQQDQAERALSKMKLLAKLQHMDPNQLLMIAYAGMNRKDAALACLQKEFARRANIIPTLKVDHIFDGIRSDPRFQDMMKQAGLAQ